MLSQLEQACKTYSTESSSGLIEFDRNWQRIFVTALTFLLDQAILIFISIFSTVIIDVPVLIFISTFSFLILPQYV